MLFKSIESMYCSPTLEAKFCFLLHGEKLKLSFFQEPACHTMEDKEMLRHVIRTGEV